MPTPQLNLDSFEVWGNAVSAAVRAVDPATPSPRFLIFEELVEILFLFVVTCGIVPVGVTSTPSINNLLP